MDEPTEGIQPSVVQLIQDVIGVIAKEKGIRVVLVEYNVDLVLVCADYIYVMDRGCMVLEGDAFELKIEDVEKHLIV